MITFFTLVLSLALSMTFFGKSIVGIGMGICVILSAVMIFQNRAVTTKGDALSLVKARETIAIMVMIALWFASAMQGINPDKSVSQALEFAGIIFGGYIIFSAVQKSDFNFEMLFQFCVIGATICAAWLIANPWLGPLSVEWGSSYGSVLTIIIPMAFYLTQKKPIWWGAILILSIAIFASGGRTAWLVLCGLVIIMPILMPIKKRILNGLLLICVIGAGALMGIQSYKNFVGDEIYEIRTQAMQNLERPASGRLTVWANTIDKISDRPFLGYGIKSAQYLEITKGGDALVIHVHNAVLEMILETGLLGFMAFSICILLFVGHFLGAYFRSDNRDDKQLAMTVLLSCIAYGVCSMALTSMFHAWWFLYLIALLILLKAMEIRLVR